MKLENLKYFLAVVRTGSIHKAAEELFLTPQNLSKIIRNIEEDVGKELFIRTSKGMILSAEGERFLPYATIIDNAFSEYMHSPQIENDNVDFYTTPALSHDLTVLQGNLLADKYYLSVQSRGTQDLRDMIQKKVPGVYLVMLGSEKVKQMAFDNVIKILECKENVWVCHKDHVFDAEHIDRNNVKVITNDHYDGNYGNVLRMTDQEQIKTLMRQGKAIYKCLEYQYTNYFVQKFPSAQEEWVVIKRMQIPAFEMVLGYNGAYAEPLKREIEHCLRKIFYTEH